MVWDVRLQQPVKIVRLGSCERVSIDQSEFSIIKIYQSDTSFLYINQSEASRPIRGSFNILQINEGYLWTNQFFILTTY